MSWAGLPDITAQSFQPICGKGVGGWNLFARAAARQYQRHEIRDEAGRAYQRPVITDGRYDPRDFSTHTAVIFSEASQCL